MTYPLAFVIEDDPTLNSIFVKAIETAGFRVQTFYDGQIAMDELIQDQPALIVLDLHLPHLSGQKILAHVRTLEHLQQTQVIIVSADTKLAEYLRDQAILVLMKPVSFHQLRQLAARFYGYTGGTTDTNTTFFADGPI